LIWSEKTYSKQGDLISQHDFTKVEINVDLADSLFEVPKDYASKVAQDFSGYIYIRQHPDKPPSNNTYDGLK
jgi:hypothetical protein